MRLPILYIVFLGTMWGLHFSIIRFAAESGIDFTNIAAYVVIGDTLVLYAIALLRKRYPWFSIRTLIYYTVCAIFGYLIPFFAELYSAPRIGAGQLTIIVSLTPVATVIVAVLLRSETITAPKIAAIGFGFLAILPFFTLRDFDVQEVLGLGLLVAFIVPVAYAIYHNYVAKYWPDGLDSWQVATGEAIAAALIMVPAFLLNGSQDFDALLVPFNMMIFMAFVLFTVLEIYLYFEIVRLAGAVFVSQASFITVATGVLWGMLFFGEQHGLWIVASMMTLGISIFLSARYSEAAQG